MFLDLQVNQGNKEVKIKEILIFDKNQTSKIHGPTFFGLAFTAVENPDEFDTSLDIVKGNTGHF